MKRLRGASDAFRFPTAAARMRIAMNAAPARLLTAEELPASANRGRDETDEISSEVSEVDFPSHKSTVVPALGPCRAGTGRSPQWVPCDFRGASGCRYDRGYGFRTRRVATPRRDSAVSR